MENRIEGNGNGSGRLRNRPNGIAPVHSLKKSAPPCVIDVGVELGYFTLEQADCVRRRHAELAARGMKLSLGQVLVERTILAPTQLKQLLREVEYRNANQLLSKPAPASAMINRKIGKYVLLEVLSENGRCRVFLARDADMQRFVVLKILPSHYTGDAQWLDRFRREVFLAGKLIHPNIVVAYGAGELNGNPYMALEYVRGRSLQNRLDSEGNLPERTAWLIAREVAKGLDYAARQGVLHRDIKPSNILCGVAGAIKICDLGLSKSMHESTALTAAGMTVGTPFYMSPEQVQASSELDIRADIYSLGCTVFHMLTGVVPFLGETALEVMQAQINAKRPDPREILPEISEASAMLVQRMMEKRAAKRPFDAEALVMEIDAILPSLPEPEEIERPAEPILPTDTKDALGSFKRGATKLFAASRWEQWRDRLMQLVSWE